LDLGEVGSVSDAGGVGGQRYFRDGLFSQFISLKHGRRELDAVNDYDLAG
jgi:hypothetical protein